MPKNYLPALCQHLSQLSIDAVVQVGLGRGREVAPLREALGPVPFTAFEPLGVFNTNPDYPGIIIPSAVGRSAGSGTLWQRDGYPEASSFYSRNDENDEAVEVPITTLDANELPGVRLLLWLDCEGFELEVLAGATSTLTRTVAVVAEVFDDYKEQKQAHKPQRPGWPKAAAVRASMDAAGFEFAYSVNRIGDVFINPKLAKK